MYLPIPPEDDHFDPVYDDFGLDPVFDNCPLLKHDNVKHIGELLPIIDFL